MATFTITIPDIKLPIVIEATCYNHHIPQIEDPQNPGDLVDEFTSQQWTREYWTRRAIRDDVHIYRTKKAARDVQKDNGVAT